MSSPREPRSRALTDHDHRRLRTTRRIALAGPVLGIAGAVALAAIGGTGRAGLASILVLTAAGCIAAALVTVLHALGDEYRGRPVALRRVGWAGGLMLATFVLLVLLGGVAGGTA